MPGISNLHRVCRGTLVNRVLCDFWADDGQVGGGSGGLCDCTAGYPYRSCDHMEGCEKRQEKTYFCR